MKMQQEWEEDHQPLKCLHCGQTPEKPFVIRRYFGTYVGNLLTFCNEDCANAYYLNNLRRRGL